ncbi:2'-5' RNA ligase [Fontibacillus phaseoli]|uniref:RNA 2',3'-cyclic phosphodiesterase n=1 Tax=Fontibacillus phaseoli TaxID=1416533 RepID=A0A369BJC4_9BACL|nr:RNA 2',3'-cyclic phosphodiesterase [Fontibacillus phaseoli]RCX20537.1 2'-5' RNA ligase [Fontibacillus phaseoli]
MEKIIESWRIFIAIPLPEAIKQALSQWTEKQKGALEFVKWVNPADYHITVQFLGDVPRNRIDAIKQRLAETAKGLNGFCLHAKEIGIFGRASNPRVLWAGLDGELDKLQSLQRSVAEANRDLGFLPEDRPYNPHITLARKYKEERKLGPEPLNANPPDFGEWAVDAIVVYRTRMGKTPMYEEVFRAPLTSGQTVSQ